MNLEQTSLMEEMDQAHEAIRIGERVRVLLEVLLETLGCTYENTHNEVWAKLKDTQDEHEKAISFINETVKQTLKK